MYEFSIDSDDEMAMPEADVDWYHESDTADNIPDPNLDRDRLYQDVEHSSYRNLILRKGSYTL